MAAFRFRLAPVLRYRTRIREQKQGELQALERAKEQVLAEVHRHEQLILQQAHEREEQRGKVVSALEVRVQGDFSQHVSQRIREQYQLLATVQRRLEEKRQDVSQADKDVKSLEQLHVRLWERHHQQEEREEQKSIDEVGQRKFYERK